MTTLSPTDELLVAATTQQLADALADASVQQRDQFFAAVAALTPNEDDNDTVVVVTYEASMMVLQVHARLQRTGTGSVKATKVDDVLIRKLWQATGLTAEPTRASVLGRIIGLQAIAALRGHNLRDKGCGLDRIKADIPVLIDGIMRGRYTLRLRTPVEFGVDPQIIALADVYRDLLTDVRLIPHTVEIVATTI